MIVNPGDIVVGDHDGVVIVPHAAAQVALEAALAKEKAEAEVIRQIKAGKLTMDLLGLDEAYRRLGLSEESPPSTPCAPWRGI